MRVNDKHRYKKIINIANLRIKLIQNTEQPSNFDV